MAAIDASVAARGRRWRHVIPPILVAIVAVATVTARRPDAVTNPQFWAEDGAVFFTQARQLGGFHALFVSYAGYLQTASRLVAWFAQAFPARQAPLIYNLFGLAVQCLPVVYLASRRYDRLSWRIRLLLIALYLLVPASGEVDVTITNSLWHLAVLMPVIVFAAPPKRWYGLLTDVALFVVAALSGPFCIFLLPFLAYYWWRQHRPRWLTALLIVDLAGCLVQGAELTLGPNSRPPAFTVDIHRLVSVIAVRVFLSLVVGQRAAPRFAKFSGSLQALTVYPVFFAGAALVVAAWVKGSTQVRLFFGYAGVLLASALFVPSSASTLTSYWQGLTLADGGQRYFFVPMLAVIVAAVVLIASGTRWLSAVGVVFLLAIVLLGVPTDFRYQPYRDFRFGQNLTRCLSGPLGSPCAIPINPPGWAFTLPR